MGPCSSDQHMLLAATPTKAVSYYRHRPEQTILYRTIQENFETFASSLQQDTEGLPLPAHVYREVDAYLDCGILAKGFIRMQCGSCKKEKLVAFSCKKRICPSCGGRRMNEAAAHLVDAVFPEVPVRQWVLSFPFSVRYALAYQPELVTKVLAIFIRVICSYYAKSARKIGWAGTTGAVTFIQRAASALNANIHFHSLFMDGVYRMGKEKPVFSFVPPPTDDEMKVLVNRVNARVSRFFKKRGIEVSGFSGDSLATEQPAFAQIEAASVQSRIAAGERAGRKVRRIGGVEKPNEPYLVSTRCAASDGFSLHANVQIKAKDRGRLEKLCRYVARHPIALERMSAREDGKILYALKNNFSDGSTHVLFDPLELVEKVVALVPPPRANLLRYHGVLAPNSKLRSQIVPMVPSPEKASETKNPSKWAALLKRSFSLDLLTCPDCCGKMKLIATIEDPSIVKKILESLGLPSAPPMRSPSRAPPQIEFDDSSDSHFSQIAPNDEWT